jgi:hypothetical protein
VRQRYIVRLGAVDMKCVHIKERSPRNDHVDRLGERAVNRVVKRRYFYTYLLYLHDADAQPASERPDL